jgi:hypothetical protein
MGVLLLDQVAGLLAGGVQRARTAGTLAVYSHLISAGRGGTEQVSQSTGARQGEHTADRGGGRSTPDAEWTTRADTEASEGILRGVARPLADGQVGAGRGQHRAGRGQQHRHKAVPTATAVTRVEQRRQPLRDVRQFTLARRGRLVRKTVADWRHIEAPVVQGDWQVTPANRSLVVFVVARPHTVTLP